MKKDKNIVVSIEDEIEQKLRELIINNLTEKGII